MKNLFLVCIAICFLNCKSDDDDPQSTSLNGQWSLITFVPSDFMPDPFDYEVGDIVWDFDVSSETFTITIKDDVTFEFIEEGTYTYDLTDNACNYDDFRYLQIVNGRGLGVLSIDEPQTRMMTITERCIDGHTVGFQKM